MKSIEVKFAEACEALKKANKFDKFREAVPIGSGATIEVQLNCAEAVLDGKVQEAEAARRTIRKHNGAADNGHLFTESGWSEYSGNTDPEIRESDRLLVESLTHPTEKRKLTEAEKRKLLGQLPVECDNLSEAQKREYKTARAMGISEPDALHLVHVTTPFYQR